MSEFLDFNEKEKPPLVFRGEVKNIIADEKSVVLEYDLIDFKNNGDMAEPISIFIEKLPIKIETGKTYGPMNDVLIDEETPKMKEISRKAEEIKLLPIKERPRAILVLLRENLEYAYPDKVDKLRESDPEMADWIDKNTGLDTSKAKVPLSEIFENKYAICRQLTVAYLWIAQKAEIEGVISCSESGVIKNIKRIDNREKLFRSAEIGGDVVKHIWVEVKINDDWIPVDPSVNLVGDYPEGFKMFKEANYYANGWLYPFEVKSDPPEVVRIDSEDAFGIGKKVSEISVYPSIKTFTNAASAKVIVPFRGNLKIIFKAAEHARGYNFKIINIKNRNFDLSELKNN